MVFRNKPFVVKEIVPGMQHGVRAVAMRLTDPEDNSFMDIVFEHDDPDYNVASQLQAGDIVEATIKLLQASRDINASITDLHSSVRGTMRGSRKVNINGSDQSDSQ
jgi:hypothetical protein